MKKPSKINVVKGKKAWFLPSNFSAITLFGIIYCRSLFLMEQINKTDNIDSKLESHETIHVRQAESTSNSWFVFYMKYIWQWLMNLPIIFVNIYAPYMFIPFELEAYANQDNWRYCLGKCENWKTYNTLSLKQKRELAKKYYKEKPYFTNFIKKEIDPLLK